MKAFDYLNEADSLAKAALNRANKKALVEARILVSENQKKLMFFFESQENVDYFAKHKEQIKAKLMGEYRKKLELYKRENFIFYDIGAKRRDEMMHRTKEEQRTLERGIAKIQALIDSKKLSKVA